MGTRRPLREILDLPLYSELIQRLTAEFTESINGDRSIEPDQSRPVGIPHDQCGDYTINIVCSWSPLKCIGGTHLIQSGHEHVILAHSSIVNLNLDLNINWTTGIVILHI